jgi:hypothetical protein
MSEVGASSSEGLESSHKRETQPRPMQNGALQTGTNRCPVIGCEKAYKNQNGLKYHKQHGHQNQHLKENDDGTFSIVDPLISNL